MKKEVCGKIKATGAKEMTGREILRQSLKVKCKLDCSLEQVQELKDLAVRITPIMKGVPTVSHNCQSKLEKAIIELEEQSEVLGDEVLKYLEVRGALSDSISAMVDENEQLILRYRYLTFKKWREIATAMNMTPRRVLQLHEQALNSFEKIYSAE